MTRPSAEQFASHFAAFCVGIIVGVVGFVLATFILWGGA